MVEAILSSPEMEGYHSEVCSLKLFSKADVPLVNLRKASTYDNLSMERQEKLSPCGRSRGRAANLCQLHIGAHRKFLSNKNHRRQPGKAKNIKSRPSHLWRVQQSHTMYVFEIIF